MKSETTVSSIVHGNTRSTSPMTGWPETIETPQSPRSAPSRNTVYCLESRQVETEPLPERVDRLAARLVAEDELRRIAGDDPHQHEDQRQHREQRDARKRQTADQEGGHILGPFASAPIALAPICRAGLRSRS